MFNIVLVLVTAAYTPYYIYKSLKRERLNQKLAGLTTSMIFVFIIIGTRPPVNLGHARALGLLVMGISFELLYLAYKEKSPFSYMAAAITATLGVYVFLQYYL